MKKVQHMLHLRFIHQQFNILLQIYSYSKIHTDFCIII